MEKLVETWGGGGVATVEGGLSCGGCGVGRFGGLFGQCTTNTYQTHNQTDLYEGGETALSEKKRQDPSDRGGVGGCKGPGRRCVLKKKTL